MNIMLPPTSVGIYKISLIGCQRTRSRQSRSICVSLLSVVVRVRVAVVVVDDLLELELDETYPDGDTGGGVFLLDEEFDRLRSIVLKMSPTVSGYGVGGRSLTGLKVCSMYF